ncbi:MAG: phosphonate C-P lyase system protein PhnH [Thermohalobaculum sp.]|nr:phosphonate C-P lyase system protein PhnH [Thermohalobaculum sp.]
MQTAALDGGFGDAPRDASHAFRALMNAMARPGRIERLAGARPPAPLSVAAGTLLLTLCDQDTPLCLTGRVDCDDVRVWVAFHTGAPLAGPADCAFAIGRWEDLAPLSAYPCGTPDYPDRSATLVIETDALAPQGAVLSGPGIRTTAALALPDKAAFQANHARFPLGLDAFFTCGAQVAALPRSTTVS